MSDGYMIPDHKSIHELMDGMPDNWDEEYKNLTIRFYQQHDATLKYKRQLTAAKEEIEKLKLKLLRFEIADLEWKKDDQEINVTDWHEEFDYMGVDEKGHIQQVAQAVCIPDAWVAGYLKDDSYIIEDFKAKAEAELWLAEQLDKPLE